MSEARHGRLDAMYQSCPECREILPLQLAICRECGWDIAACRYSSDRACRNPMPRAIQCAVAIIALATLGYALYLNRHSDRHAGTLMPALIVPEPASNSTSPASSTTSPETIASSVDLASPEYVGKLVDDFLNAEYPRVLIGDPLSFQRRGGDQLEGRLLERNKRIMIILDDADARHKVRYTELPPELRLRCDDAYRAEYRHQTLQSQLRQRKEQFGS